LIPRSVLPRAPLLLIAACCLVLAACKSGGGLDALAPDKTDPGAADAGAPASVAPDARKIGSGPVHIAVLLPFSAAGADAEEARDVRDGVTMAVEDLGKDALTVTFEDTSGANIKNKATKAISDEASALIGPFDRAGAAELLTLKGSTLPPVFLLADVPGRRGLYSVPLQTGASAAAGTNAVSKAGGRSFVLLVPEGSGAAATEKAVDHAAANFGGRLAATARYGRNVASVGKAVDTVFSVVAQPDAVVVAGDFDPATVLAAIRARNAKVTIVGNNSWLAQPLSASFDGVVIADIDRGEMQPVADRYHARFGRDFDLLAAYAYDTIALSTGIAKGVGKEGFIPQIIEDGKGFRGATGVFRFRGDGNTDRLVAIYKVVGGKLKRQEAPPAKF
jgi:hypothetical protein